MRRESDEVVCHPACAAGSSSKCTTCSRSPQHTQQDVEAIARESVVGALLSGYRECCSVDHVPVLGALSQRLSPSQAERVTVCKPYRCLYRHPTFLAMHVP
jgi:hypothetical protein